VCTILGPEPTAGDLELSNHVQQLTSWCHASARKHTSFTEAPSSSSIRKQVHGYMPVATTSKGMVAHEDVVDGFVIFHTKLSTPRLGSFIYSSLILQGSWSDHYNLKKKKERKRHSSNGL
jgi:hypothetical protein